MTPLYFLKSGLAIAVFYLLYCLLLRKGTHFRLNRMVLLSTLLLGVVLPIITFPSLKVISPAMPVFSISFDSETPSVMSSVLNATRNNDHLPIGWMIYLMGVFIVLARIFYQNVSINRMLKDARRVEFYGISVYFVKNECPPFSYLNKIIIPESRYSEASLKEIIEHERVHLKQYHHFDALMAELVLAFQWFNPFVWLFERLFNEIHEFLADEAVIKKGIPQGKYQALLVNEVVGGPVFTMSNQFNQFNQSLIKKRIVMMTKKKNSEISKWKVLWFLPFIGGMMMAFAAPSSKVNQALNSVVPDFPFAQEIGIKGTVTDQSTGQPISGVHVILAGTTTGTSTDDNGAFDIKSPTSSGKLVFSCVGYKTIIEEIGNRTSISCQMVKDAYAIDLTNKNQLNPTVKESTAGKKEVKEKEVFVAVEEMPSYPGGTDALKQLIKKNISYPEDAKKQKIEGRVVIRFTINELGKPEDCTIVRSVSPVLHKEALRLANLMDKWNPGLQNGKPVKVMVEIPIDFKLN